MEKIFKNDKEFMAQVKVCKRWKKMDFMCYACEMAALVDMIVKKYNLRKEDAEFIAENFVK